MILRKTRSAVNSDRLGLFQVDNIPTFEWIWGTLPTLFGAPLGSTIQPKQVHKNNAIQNADFNR